MGAIIINVSLHMVPLLRYGRFVKFLSHMMYFNIFVRLYGSIISAIGCDVFHHFF